MFTNASLFTNRGGPSYNHRSSKACLEQRHLRKQVVLGEVLSVITHKQHDCVVSELKVVERVKQASYLVIDVGYSSRVPGWCVAHARVVQTQENAPCERYEMSTSVVSAWYEFTAFVMVTWRTRVDCPHHMKIHNAAKSNTNAEFDVPRIVRAALVLLWVAQFILCGVRVKRYAEVHSRVTCL